MSRSGYSDDVENVHLWRGAVSRAIGGRRGQAFLHEMLAAMDAMPVKELIANELENEGAVCAIGTVGKVRGIDMSAIDPEDNDAIAAIFGLPFSLACEIMYLNDEYEIYDRNNHRYLVETPEQRFVRIRAWIESKLRPATPGAP